MQQISEQIHAEFKYTESNGFEQSVIHFIMLKESYKLDIYNKNYGEWEKFLYNVN